ncbi:MAG TPA: DUF416 family protein [Pirellulales bacterium]|jgi:uncharacterized protein YjaG (DUF416 family)|nr:DUF416 family protein [Pirellulales bacterium]
MLTFNERALKQQLDRLPRASRVAFAATCAQRLAGVCNRFVGTGGRADRANLFDDALNYVWTYILTTPEEATTGRLLADVMAMIPDQDAPGWTPLTAYGEDALSALAYSLRCLQSGDSQEAAWSARCIYEGLDYFVTLRDNVPPNEPGADVRVLSDPLIQAELERQARDIAELSSAGDSLSRELLDGLRQRSLAEQAIATAR